MCVCVCVCMCVCGCVGVCVANKYNNGDKAIKNKDIQKKSIKIKMTK